MSSKYDEAHFLTSQDWLVWILAPFVRTEDPTLQYYYDFSQSIEEYTRVFNELKLNWKWQAVEIDTYKEIIQGIRSQSGKATPIVINLCDGDESNGVPGISVIHELEANELIFTGADPYFYQITTSKIPMKELFDQHQVPTSPWMLIDLGNYDASEVFRKLKSPLIVKPAISGGSLGLGLRSVVHNETELRDYLNSIKEGYKGWDLASGGFFIEEFIAGQEYTTLIVGPSDEPGSSMIYDPVERVFESSIPSTEQFLSFDRLWEFYEQEKPIEQEKALWNYSRPAEELIEEIKTISWQAYVSMKGKGYGRVDLRRDAKTGKIMVLEVNAQCGLSEDENYTSIGAILRLSDLSFTSLIRKIMYDAFHRQVVHVLK